MISSVSSKAPRAEIRTPFDKATEEVLIHRLRHLAYQAAERIGLLPLGPLWAFVGYDRAELLEHLERRHLQGCLICGQELDGRPVVCHIDPLGAAHDGASLQRLMALENFGFGHDSCNRRLGARSIS